ncbi:MAG TPA: zinc-ribbon domain-containing protein [Candidatus Paceibacterota bacterium]
MEDKILICQDCGEEFVFTISEQEFFESKMFQNPKRCPDCRRARKQEKESREY